MMIWNETLLFILLLLGDIFGAFVLSIMDKLEFIFRRLVRSRGCLGRSTKPPVIISMDGESKGLIVKEDKRSDDLLSSSTFEMDQRAAQSRKSISSIGTSNQPSDPQTSAGSQIDHPEFVNHGLILWNQIRQQWVENGRSESPTQVEEPRISGDATYESLLGSNKQFPRPIPLGEMVDFLVDIWEQEGLYD